MYDVTCATTSQKLEVVSRMVIPLLHWIIAVLIIFQDLLGVAMLQISWPQQRPGSSILVHGQIGVMILLLTVISLTLRLYIGRRSNDEL